MASKKIKASAKKTTAPKAPAGMKFCQNECTRHKESLGVVYPPCGALNDAAADHCFHCKAPF